MTLDRGKLNVETLLKVVLLLIAALLVLEIFSTALGLIPEFIRTIVTLVIALLLVLWLLDRI